VPPASGATGTGEQDSGGVRDRASGVASQAGDAGREVAQDAKERAGEVAHEAKDRARDLLQQARSEMSDQVTSQQERLAAGLRHLGSELTQMSRASDDPGYATQLAERGSGMADRLADWFEQREPADVMSEVQSFARRRPGAFLAIAAGAGLVVGRMLRGAKASNDGSSGQGSASATYTTATDTSLAPPAYVPSTTPVAPATSVPPTPGGGNVYRS
jgi:ElaB/YqjD/DUF883 family membrane-anchored ribosome-binding protein